MEHCEGQSTVGETPSSYRKHRCNADKLIKLTQHGSEASSGLKFLVLYAWLSKKRSMLYGAWELITS